ncbi:MAG: MFS transporter [Verrucomicrobiae bacterium]|nr:MFS transporter [Verrucomicrobiae bacterium]
MSDLSAQAIAQRNARLFIAFRSLFNARFYYPVFAIIYLDFGLTLEQFALLNVIWAVTIILAEVPSGALSDLFGRKKLLVFTTTLMVAEMAVWSFAPRAYPVILFWILAINRVLSGLGEASASGSDEALVYDSLDQAGIKEQWSEVLAKTSRVQSFAFMLAMVLGGVIYDPGIVQRVANLLGLSVEITKDTVLRWPVILTLCTAIIVFVLSLRFIEPEEKGTEKTRPQVWDAFKQTFRAGQWIGRTPFALIVIVAGAYTDSVVRMFVTLTSQYYELISFTPVFFGFIGAGISALGIFTASLSKWLVDRHTPTTNFIVICSIAMVGFVGARFFIPYIGLLFAILLFVAFSITMFALSYYLNHVTEKSMRATVPSFKGMAGNLGYGFIGWLYAMLTSYLRNDPVLAANEDALFRESVNYFPWYFAVGIILVVFLALWRCPKPNQSFRKMDAAVKD